MNEWMEQILPCLEAAARQNSRYDREYTFLCRNAERSFRAFWDSLSKKQKKLYLRFEADNNAQSAAEEDQLVCQTVRLTRELYGCGR